jgi:DNA-binding MarR family transcriptional regulator
MKESRLRDACCWHEGQPLGGYLVRIGRLLEERADTTLAQVGLSSAKLTVLSHLVSSRDPMPLGELAVRLSCVRSNITQLVDRMESDGLVRRVDDPADRRAVRAELTAVGRERQEEGARLLAELEKELEDRLSADDKSHLVDALGKLG